MVVQHETVVRGGAGVRHGAGHSADDGGFAEALLPSMSAVVKSMHAEHYGNIVVYMRLKGHVPPSTARAQQPKQ
jgi:hypothetical protein